ncbi:efflux RND transporter periplasmic adaptor subunit [Mucilaginibacter sp. E4BP6]|uniref:efflux RND transporter periplasmic adaptor subunit n=1 Tax=Mucilaginibacter sp. E4BP6 TaxID=2723089 RepID=UPI0017D2EE84|nr:HlyD family efflux transporter periplasmic adaptor subunit [Mucilaginibacter sp. E4BP6]NYE65456.1 multidrug efflux pump subunit AcrA (membrane-fusion protein) [Mucilaginibacter sp. E4BP6]
MKTSYIKYIIKQPALMLMIALGLLSSCGSKKDDSGDDDKAVNAQVSVTVTGVSDSDMVDYTTLNASSAFQQKNYVKSNTNGYITKVNAQLGQFTDKGQILFTVKTKESMSIGNSVNVLDTTFKFSGVNKIKAPMHGYITQLNHQLGDYVQDGEQLAVISDRSSFAFIMQLPYEMRTTVKLNQDVQLTLPGGEKVDGKVTSFMPAVDTASQTQGVVIKINTDKQIPENLVAKARIVRTQIQNATSLPKAAVLSNDTQTDFWVMKIINPTTAVKVPVKTGLEVGDRIQIISPKFSKDDRIVVTGNYGLTDTAKVKIVQ